MAADHAAPRMPALPPLRLALPLTPGQQPPRPGTSAPRRSAAATGALSIRTSAGCSRSDRTATPPAPRVDMPSGGPGSSAEFQRPVRRGRPAIAGSTVDMGLDVSVCVRSRPRKGAGVRGFLRVDCRRGDPHGSAPLSEPICPATASEHWLGVVQNCLMPIDSSPNPTCGSPPISL